MTGAAAIATDDLRIRRAEPSDHAAVAAILAGPKSVAGTLQLPMPSIDRVRERMANADPQTFAVVAEVRTAAGDVAPFEVVGHLDLFAPSASASPRRRHVVGLGIAVRDDWQGRGIGHALLCAALDRADNWMNVLRIELTAFADNAHAIALYRRHGFVVEGTHRAYALRDGVYADAVSMARLHPKPPVLPSIVPSTLSSTLPSTPPSTPPPTAVDAGLTDTPSMNAFRTSLLSLLAASTLGGCVVVAVADTAGTVAVKTVGLAADAAVGTAKVAGKVVGKAADAATGGDDAKK